MHKVKEWYVLINYRDFKIDIQMESKSEASDRYSY